MPPDPEGGGCGAGGLGWPGAGAGGVVCPGAARAGAAGPAAGGTDEGHDGSGRRLGDRRQGKAQRLAHRPAVVALGALTHLAPRVDAGKDAVAAGLELPRHGSSGAHGACPPGRQPDEPRRRGARRVGAPQLPTALGLHPPRCEVKDAVLREVQTCDGGAGGPSAAVADAVVDLQRAPRAAHGDFRQREVGPRRGSLGCRRVLDERQAGGRQQEPFQRPEPDPTNASTTLHDRPRLHPIPPPFTLTAPRSAREVRPIVQLRCATINRNSDWSQRDPSGSGSKGPGADQWLPPYVSDRKKC